MHLINLNFFDGLHQCIGLAYYIESVLNNLKNYLVNKICINFINIKNGALYLIHFNKKIWHNVLIYK